VDESAFLDCYDLVARDLVGFFAQRTGDAQLAVDLLPVTFLAAFEQRAACRATTQVQRAAWVYLARRASVNAAALGPMQAPRASGSGLNVALRPRSSWAPGPRLVPALATFFCDPGPLSDQSEPHPVDQDRAREVTP
jgi:hypothetical protein